jgi:hypothetical protein
MPEFLCNVNGVKFGEMQQNQQPMGDVGLPPWARSPEEFVRINREALGNCSLFLPRTSCLSFQPLLIFFCLYF